MATGGESTGVTSCTQAVPLTSSNAIKVCDILKESGFSTVDWETLALRLGVTDTESILAVHPRKPFLCLYDVIHQWLQSDSQASWMKLAAEVSKVEGYGPNTAQTILMKANAEHTTAPSIQLSSQLQTADYIIKYAKLLKHYYKNMSVLPSSRDDWPLSLGRQFTKLTIIEKQERFPDSEQAENLEADCIHGRVNKIAAQEKVIEDVTELFESKATVLLDGAPGIGKTTLCRKACKDWADGTKLQNYQLVVLLPLRERRVREAKVVDDLFRADDPKLQREVVQHIKETSGEHLLLILDGYDELTLEEQTEESLFSNIIERNQLQKCSVLVTSRPYASDDLLHCVGYHVEVLGLTEEQVRNCFIQNCSGKKEATKLTKMLQERPDITSLCYTPLNCAIVLYVYKHGRFTLPKTLTQFFEIFVLHTLKHHAKNLTPKQKKFLKVAETLEQIPNPVKSRLHALYKLAFTSLTTGKLFFSIMDLEEEFSECSEADIEMNILGLMTAVKGFSIRGEQINFQFLHLSLQEFLAARYAAVNLSAKEQTELIQRHLGGSHLHLRMMLLFLAGISGLKGIKIEKIFSEVLNVISGPYSKHLHADIDCGSRYSQFPYWYRESSYSAPQGQYQLSYWLDKSHYNSAPQNYSASKLSTVSSSNCDHESYPKSLYAHQKALNKFILLLHLLYESQSNIYNLYWNVQAMVKKEKLHFSFCQLTPSDCMVLGHFLSATPRPWKLLQFYFCSLTGHSIEIFCKTFSGYTNCVEEVRISYSSSSVLTRLSLLPKIPWLKYTKKVTLQGIQYPPGIPPEHIELHSILDMQNLTDLTLLVERIPEEHITDYGIALSHFMTAVVHSKKLEKLSYAGPFPPNCDLTIFQILQHTLSAHTALNELSLAIPRIGEVQISQYHFVLLLSQESDTELVCNQIFKQSIVNMDSLTSPCTETFILICRNCDFITRLSLLPRVPLMKHAKHVRLVKEYSVKSSAEQTMPHSLAKVFEHKILADNPLWHLDVMLLGLGKVTLQHNNLPYIKVELEDTPVTEKCQQFFEAMDECSFQHQTLSVQGLRDTGTDQFASGLCGNKSVKILDISTNNISSASVVAIFRSLECNTSLEELDMSHNKQLTEGDSTSEAVGCAVERMLTWNETLKVLKLTGCGLNDSVLRHISTGLSHNNSLDLLDITCNSFSVVGMLHIWKTQKYTKTRQIEFDKQSFATTNPQYIGELLNMCGMKCPFEIFPLSVTDIGEVNAFTEEQKELVSYKLTLEVSTTTTAEAFVQFFNGLNPPTLPFPELSVRGLTGQTAEHFAAGLAVNTSVRKLDISKNNISSAGAEAIFKSLEHNTSLETLDLSKNGQHTVGDSEAVGCAVERMMRVSKTLKVLKLVRCRVTDVVVKHIAEGLNGSECTMNILDISKNSINSAGAVAIFRSLEHNTSLETLDLTLNFRLAEGDNEAVGCVVERMLRGNKILRVLKLRGCGLNDVVLRHISTGLSHNKSLDLLDITCNNFSAVGMLYIQEHIRTPQLHLEFDEEPSASTNPQSVNKLLNMCDIKCPFKLFPLSVTDIGKMNMFTEEQTEFISYKLELKVSTTTTAEAFVQFFNGLNPPTLTFPELSVRGLTDQTAEHFAAGLAVNMSVKTLDISKNNIRSAGAEAIFRSLECNTSLETLDLTLNIRLTKGDSESVGCAIERMLTVNKTLKVLKLRGCGLNDVVLRHISTGLSHNKSLDLLDIACNNFSTVGMVYIQKHIGTRQIEL